MVWLIVAALTIWARSGSLLDYPRSVNELLHNALIRKCTANIRIRVQSQSASPLAAWFNGKSDEYASQHGRLAGDLPFE